MAITYQSQTGTTVTSYAMDETLGDQSQQSGNNTVVVSDDIATAGNGQIGTKYPTYVRRKVIIELGETDEQERMVISQAAGTGNTIILTLNEDWDVNPVSTDTIHVMYNIDDLETGGAGGGIQLNVRTGLYELTNFLTVGNGTDPAGLLLHEATALECDDKGLNSSFTIFNNGRFDTGYMQAGKPVSGGIITAYNNSSSEPWMRWQSGSLGYVLDCLLWAQLFTQTYRCVAGSGVVFRAAKFISATDIGYFLSATLYDCMIEGRGSGIEEQIRINNGTTIEVLTLIATNGFYTDLLDTTTETVEIRDVVFINNDTLINVESNKTWNVINPVWSVDEASQNDINFITGTSNTVNERYSIDVIVQEADGTKLQNALVIIYENTQLGDLVQELVSDVNGVAAGSWLYKNFVDNAGTSLTVTTYGGHALRVDKWLYQPFVAAQASNEKREGFITLLDDPNIVQTTQATALTAGSGVTWNEDTNPSSIIAYTGGTGTLSVGNTVTGGTSGADGIVTKIVSGDSAAGTVHLKTRDAVDFSGTEGLSNGSGWTATLTSGSQQDFSIWIDGNSIAMQALFDFYAALTSQTTLSTAGEIVHEWGRDSQARAVYLGQSGFYTDRSYSKGIFITNYGAGTIEKLTADDGTTWTPPASKSFKFTVDPSITGYEWRIYSVTALGSLAGAVELAGEESATVDNQTYGYVYASDIFIAVQLIPQPDEDYVEKTSYYTLKNANQDVSIQLQKDINN